jgi:hypothetical protein
MLKKVGLPLDARSAAVQVARLPALPRAMLVYAFQEISCMYVIRST